MVELEAFFSPFLKPLGLIVVAVGRCLEPFFEPWPVVTCQARDGERALLGDAWAAPALELQQGSTATATAIADQVSISQHVSIGPGMTKIQWCERSWKMCTVHKKMPKMDCGSWPHDSMRVSHFHIRSGQKSGARIRDFSLQTSKLPLAISLEMLSILYYRVCRAARVSVFQSEEKTNALRQCWWERERVRELCIRWSTRINRS